MRYQRAWSTTTTSSSSSDVAVAAAATAALKEEASCIGREAIKASSVVATTSATNNNSSIITRQRHGVGDAIVCLNVGGQEFYTLRSTIQTSPILESIVASAEANPSALKMTETGAIFVDRDPTHFPTILEYLRLRAENNNNNLQMLQQQQQQQESLSSAMVPSRAAVNAQLTAATTTAILSSRIKGAIQQNVVGLKAATAGLDPAAGCRPLLDASGIPLPHDHKTMSALYMEATYHGITELQQALTEHSFWARVKSLFGIVAAKGSTAVNPFNAAAATKAFTLLRASLLAVGGVIGTMTVTKKSDDDSSIVSRCLSWVGMLAQGDDEEGEDGEEEARGEDAELDIA
jgi:BTB/POZ domain